MAENVPFDDDTRAEDYESAHERVLHGARVEFTRGDEAAAWSSFPGVTATGEWGHLRLLDRVGGGSYGAVFRAWDPALDREVALKLLQCTPDARGSEAARLVDEARLLARVRHPNVVAIYGAERIAGCVGLWMEFVDGRSLEELLGDQGEFGAAEAGIIGLTLARALSAVHRAGLVHRDVKPQNVLRERGGRIVLMDFGIGFDARAQASAPEVAGTPLYIAPELLAGDEATPRSDIYSLGVLLFHLVTGEYPIAALTFDDARAAHRAREYRYLHDVRSDLPEAFVRVVERALQPDPSRRFESAGALEAALSHAAGVQTLGVESGRTGGRVARLRAAAAALLAVTAAAAMFFVGRSTAAVDQPTFQRLTFRHGRVIEARYTPDGQNVVYAGEFGGGRPQLFTTATNSLESRPLGVSDAKVLSLSTRGELALLLRPRFLRGYVETGTLARMSVSGGGIRELLADVQEADWGPDGEALAVVRDVNGRNRLEFPVGTVLFETGGWVSHARVAPDGSAIAFVEHPTPADDSGHVAIVDRSGRARRLTDRWASAQGLAWSGDDEIWFTASASGSARALYAVNTAGRERLVHRGSGRLRIHDVRNGAALVTEDVTRISINAWYPGDTQEKDYSWLDWSLARDISEDGERLLMNESGEGGGEHYTVYLRPMNGGPAVKLGHGSGLALSPDGRWVLATRPGPPRRLVLLPTSAGEARELTAEDLGYQPWGSWTPDGSAVVFAATSPGRGSRVFVQSVSGGAARAVTPEGVFLTSPDAVSPDGRWIAAAGPGDLALLYPLSGGEPRMIAGALPNEVPLHWSRDGRALFMWARGEAPARIASVDIQTGARSPWKALMPADPTGVNEILRIVLAPDSGAYAYSYTRELSTLFRLSNDPQ
jgi:Tol biopolymer transport system component